MNADQQKAMALARARRRRADAQQQGGWSAAGEADQIERLKQPGTFLDATDSSMMKAIPFMDEITSGIGAPFRAAGDYMAGRGFDIPRAYDEKMQVEAELQRRRDDRSPIASTVGAIAGGLGATAGLSKAGFSFLNGAKPTLGSMAGRGAAEGAAYGAAYGAGEGRGLQERAWNAGKGAAIGGVTGGVTGAIGSVGAGRAAPDAAPAVDELRYAAKQAYKAADNAGVSYAPQAIDSLKTGLLDDLSVAGFHPRIHPKMAAVVDEIGQLGDGPVPLGRLEQLRRIAGSAAKSNEPDERRVASIAIEAIDDFVDSVQSPQLVTSGDPQAAASALSTARDMWSRLRKQELVADTLRAAELRTASTGSGGNLDNATRQRFASLLLNKKAMRGFTDMEKGLIEQVVRGTAGQNALRLIGKLAPTGVVSGGIGSAIGAAAGAPLGPAGAAAGAIMVPALGSSAKFAADGMTKANAALVDALIRNGGKAMPQASTAISGPRQALIEALVRANAVAGPGGR